jgi:hypothetical protein
MDTGYYIKGLAIYGPAGYTGYRINRRKHIIGRKGDTRHWIYGEHIYSSLEGNTGYWIEDGGRICGPSSELPWEQNMVSRVKRAKQRKAAQRKSAQGSRLRGSPPHPD